MTAGSEIHDEADVIVVGSGAAGAVVAAVLAERGVDVILLEEGPEVLPEVLRTDMASSLKHLWREGGFQAAMGRSVTPILQGRCVGGTTVINGAIIHRMPEPIHALWRQEFGLSDRWSYDELTRAFDELDVALSVAPTPERLLGGNGVLMKNALAARGLQGNAIARNAVDCQGSSHCNQGCPSGRKQSMANTMVPRALRAGARLHAGLSVQRVSLKGDRADGVWVRQAERGGGLRGPRMRLKARHAVVLAASAIQTPQILLRSKLGTRSGLVGRRLQAHPGTAVVGEFDVPVKLRVGATQSFESTHFWHERMKFETVAMPVELMAARLPGLGAALVNQIADYNHLAVWGVQVRAKAHGSVGLGMFGGTRLNYDLTTEDVRVLARGVRTLGELMFEAGAAAVYPGVYGLPERITSADALKALDALDHDPARYHCIAAHLFGTAVLGPSPSRSVVNPALQCHEVGNLYVADSSVFPTNLGVNPQHTISAVAYLLGESLAERTLAERRSERRQRSAPPSLRPSAMLPE